MNELNIISKAILTMSSREIAELVNSRHDSVKRSMETLRDKGVISFTQSVETSHGGAGARPVEVYLLDKRSSLIAVAQLCPEFTARIVDRWQELEAQAAQPAAPVALSRMDILTMAIESERRAIEAESQLALAAPKVAFVERYVESTGLKGFREVCKLLGANEARFREFLTDNKIMYRLGGSLTAHAPHLDAGRFEVRAGASDQNGHAYNVCKFTSKGVEWIAGEWAKHNVLLEMRYVPTNKPRWNPGSGGSVIQIHHPNDRSTQGGA